MKERILKNWTIARSLYALAGTAIIIHGIISHDWVAASFGTYIASMGIFSFGCAAGQCSVPPSRPHMRSTPESLPGGNTTDSTMP